MNADAYFGIGHSHKVCEDYALADVHDDMAYAIVSDGCSSSKHTDIGARLISHIAKDALLYMHKRKLLYDLLFIETTFKSMFEEMVIKKVLEVKDSLHLTVDVFDATLLVAVCLNSSQYLFYGRGDGYFIIVDKDYIKRVQNVHYKSNAPYYLSYDMSFDKEAAYKGLYGKEGAIIGSASLEPDFESANRNESDIPSMESGIFIFETLEEPIHQIVLTSDGVESFENTDEDFAYRKVDPYRIIDGFTNFKNPVGEFVQRRLNSFKKSCTKNNTVHQDDISCAAINIQGDL
jgi:hypothetical protein